jgi:hypothetical protein
LHHDGLYSRLIVVLQACQGVYPDSWVLVLGMRQETLDEVIERSLPVDLAVDLFRTVLCKLL